ncbi:MAG: hypothetical protein L6Q71_07970 [Planctomycetes bacterium]|nr:hypothetical protein [Planctomycetota bacterium]NUQ34151.1 hypothetical protein [Planctomycetaceae bacterium]
MMTFIKVILGIAGVAALGGGAYLYFTDGGLALELRERDAKLQAMGEKERRQTLEEWSKIVHIVAEERRQQENAPAENSSPSTVENDTDGNALRPNGANEGFETPEKPKASAELTNILELSGKARTSMQVAGATWREKYDASGFENALRETHDAYDLAIKAWPSLSPVNRVIAAEEIRQLREATIVKFLGVHSTYGAAVKDGTGVEKALKAARVLEERFASLTTQE